RPVSRVKTRGRGSSDARRSINTTSSAPNDDAIASRSRPMVAKAWASTSRASRDSMAAGSPTISGGIDEPPPGPDRMLDRAEDDDVDHDPDRQDHEHHRDE